MMRMTKKELIAKVKSESYKENVINTIKALHGLGYEEAARTMQELYTDAKALTVTAKASGKYSDDPELNEALSDYASMRAKIKKPLTSKALERAMIKLESLSHGDKNLKIQLLNQSTDNCWIGIFPLRAEKAFERKLQNPQCSQFDAILGSISND